jgi:hypothetical protein
MAGALDASGSIPALDNIGGPDDDLRLLAAQRACDAALALAHEAEREATRERDAVDARIHAALARAA